MRTSDDPILDRIVICHGSVMTVVNDRLNGGIMTKRPNTSSKREIARTEDYGDCMLVCVIHCIFLESNQQKNMPSFAARKWLKCTVSSARCVIQFWFITMLSSLLGGSPIWDTWIFSDHSSPTDYHLFKCLNTFINQKIFLYKEDAEITGINNLVIQWQNE